LIDAAKFFVAGTKNFFDVPNFVARNKTIFFRGPFQGFPFFLLFPCRFHVFKVHKSFQILSWVEFLK